MKKTAITFLVALTALALPRIGGAVPISADFSDYPGAPTSTGQADLDTASANSWFNENYGITFSGVYLYWDARDAFDNLGIANDVGGTGVGTIFFSDTTDFVTVDWTTISSQDIYLDVYDASNNLLDSYYQAGSGTTSGTITLAGTEISRMTFHDGGGQVGISTLSYDYDGVTDGRNDDIAPVPEPGTLLLLGSGLAGLAGYRRKRRM